MSVTGAIAIAACERVERTGGPRAGLVAWKALATGSSDADTRGKALIAGLRSAMSLHDVPAAVELVGFWGTVDRGDWPIGALCKELARARMLPVAVTLAEADATRHRTAGSLYRYARCLDVSRDPRRVEWLAKTVARAEKEGKTPIVTAARLRLASLLAESWDTLGDALDEAAKIASSELSDLEKLALARVQLFSGSRFTRAAAIGLLADVEKNEEVVLRLRAKRLAARYVDEAASAITPLEQDRLNALLKDAMHGLEPGLETRARDIVRGRFEPMREDIPLVPPDAKARRLARHGEVLDVAVALRDGHAPQAARSLRPLALAAELGERLPREVIAVAHVALADRDEDLRDVALRYVRVFLARPSYIVPPRGFLALADVLAASHPDLAMTARRAAAVRRETGAVAALATVLTRQGWEAARNGTSPDARPHAIQLLREAKALILKG